MSGFKKGESGNPAGRPKGSTNKITAALREKVADFLNDNFEEIKKDFKSLKPAERVRFYCDLLQYGLPKLQAMHLETDFEKLTDEDIDKIINTLKNPNNTENEHG